MLSKCQLMQQVDIVIKVNGIVVASKIREIIALLPLIYSLCIIQYRFLASVNITTKANLLKRKMYRIQKP